MELNNAIEIAKNYLGNEYFDGLNITYVKTEEPLKLKVTRNGKNVVITYSEKVCLFRGLTFIKEKEILFSRFKYLLCITNLW